ncbi:glycosyltransferase [Myxococcota bacterium]
MKLAMLTSGRFWLVDLARELHARGHEVKVYSLVPSWITRKFGLPAECNRWLGPYVAPLYAATRAARGGVARRVADRALREGLDYAVSKIIEPCDAFMGMSGMSLFTIEALHKRGVRRTFLERGSRHIVSQREIMSEISVRAGNGPNGEVPSDMVYRELAEYELADTVTVPSRQAEESFVERGFPARKLFRNPFGVKLEDFQATLAPPPNPRTLVMCGTFGRRKGADVLLEAVSGMKNVRLMHLGSGGDVPAPREPWFEGVGVVPQQELRRHYSRAHVAVLASREEGLALVQPQQLACGLPLVCTDRTGGVDLRPYLRDPNSITEVKSDDVSALRAALESALDRATATTGLRDLIQEEQREELSWRGYARRYEQRLVENTA